MDFDDLEEVAADRAAHGDESAAAAMGAATWEDVKLYYWPAVGRNRQIQLCLAELGATWKDMHWEAEHMNNSVLKDKFFAKCKQLGGNVTTNVPMLELSGKFYTQSTAVLKFVGRRGNLYPTSLEECFRVDNIICAAEDLRSLCYSVRATHSKAVEAFKKEGLPRHLRNFTQLLGDEDFFSAAAFSVADIAAFDALHTFAEGQVPGCLEDFPRLTAFCSRIGKRPRIAEYLESEQAKALVQISKTV